ncbi:MAG: SRPBCC family protein [Betaproteobacteria bacterium]|nr:SRPBCC family protein [Betaproteobacteria bacterium]
MLALMLLFATLPARGVVPGFPDVVDSSFTEANGDRTLQLAIVVPASAKDAFAAFATAEGWKTWAVPFAVGEPRVGAVMETAYRLDAKPGDRGNIRNQFIAWLPERLVVFRNVQAPPDFPNPDLFAKVVSVVEFVPIGPASTRIVMSGVGYGPGTGLRRTLQDVSGRQCVVAGPIEAALRDRAGRLEGATRAETRSVAKIALVWVFDFFRKPSDSQNADAPFFPCAVPMSFARHHPSPSSPAPFRSRACDDPRPPRPSRCSRCRCHR